MEGGYRYHDMILGVLLGLAGEATTVMLASDHGFHPDHLRPRNIPHEPAGPAAQHRPYGIFAIQMRLGADHGRPRKLIMYAKNNTVS